MPDEQERRSSKRRTPKSASARDAADARASEPAGELPGDADPREPVDFRAAAQRLAARAAHIAQLKADVEAGTYRASADETARAMDRRSDS